MCVLHPVMSVAIVKCDISRVTDCRIVVERSSTSCWVVHIVRRSSCSNAHYVNTIHGSSTAWTKSASTTAIASTQPSQTSSRVCPSFNPAIPLHPPYTTTYTTPIFHVHPLVAKLLLLPSYDSTSIRVWLRAGCRRVT